MHAYFVLLLLHQSNPCSNALPAFFYSSPLAKLVTLIPGFIAICPPITSCLRKARH